MADEIVSFGRLRELVHAPASASSWQRICALLEATQEQARYERTLPYLEHHMQQWPDAIRLAQRSWFGRRDPQGRWPASLLLARALEVKILYFGAGHSGRRSALEALHAHSQVVERGELRHDDDRNEGHSQTWLCLEREDLLPRGRHIIARVHTVRSSIMRSLRYRDAFSQVDALVFVADSGPDRQFANRIRVGDLRDELLHWTRNQLEDLPLVVHCSKRDLADALPLAQMQQELFPGADVPWVEVRRHDGQLEGAWEVLQRSLDQIRDHLHRQAP